MVPKTKRNEYTGWVGGTVGRRWWRCRESVSQKEQPPDKELRVGHNNSALIVFWQRDNRKADVCSHQSISLVLANHKVSTWGPATEAEGFNNDALIVFWQRDYRKADVYSRQLLQNSCLAAHSN